MYLRHFGLRELPFSLTPDTQYFLGCPPHAEALNLLLFATRSGEGFTKVVGEVGTGKTLLCRKLLRELGDGLVTAYLPHPPRSASGVIGAVSRELGVVPRRGVDLHEKLHRLSERLIELDAEGSSVVLLLDEAQALPVQALEAVRLLTNLETERKKLLQVVLFGQPELETRLSDPALRQLRQRITFAHRLRPLSAAELGDYVEHRLRVAGFEGSCLFLDTAVAALSGSSRGIPRLVNVLAHKSLLAAYGRGDALVGPKHVRRAASDTEGVQGRRFPWSRLWSHRPRV